MATYAELFGLRSYSALLNKVHVAVMVAAEAIRTEDGAVANHANRLLWSKVVFEAPGAEANRMYMAILAANKDIELAAIQGASDSQIQTQVDAAVDHFATG